MTIEGNAYPKTTWDFEERPVTSAKLNQWDDRIESALELGYSILAMAQGGTNGVLRGADSTDLKITATSPVSATVNVEAGYALINGYPFALDAQASLPSILAPITHPRIDLVQAKLEDWTIEVKTGTESASPSAPTVDADAISLAEIYTRVGMSVIKDVDDLSNGYIADIREFV